MIGHVQQNISMIVCMFFSLPHCTLLIGTLQIFATRKRVNHEGEYGLEIPKNSNFYGPKKRPLNQLKNKIKKIEENANETVKHCLKCNEYKLLTRNVLYDLLFSVSAILRSALGYIYQNTIKRRINQAYQLEKSIIYDVPLSRRFPTISSLLSFGKHLKSRKAW